MVKETESGMLSGRRPELARKLGCDEREMRRMLDPRHPSKLLRVEEALEVFRKAPDR